MSIHIIEPMGGYFQVRYVSGKKLGEKKTESGLILSIKQEEKNRVVQVLTCGPGLYNPMSGGRFQHGIKPGDLLYVNQHGPITIEHIKAVGDQEETFLLGETDVFAVYCRYQEALNKGICDPIPDECLNRIVPITYEPMKAVHFSNTTQLSPSLTPITVDFTKSTIS